MNIRVLALSGGVGGAKLVAGLAAALPPDELLAVVNTGDDFTHLGLHISPDIDSVVYALTGLADPVRGWGRRDETWNFMAALRELGGEGWFALGDADLAMHVERTRRLAAGETLSAATRAICGALGIAAQVVPLSDDPIRTLVRTDEGWLDFQRYFVEQQCRPAVRELRFEGAARAQVLPQVLQALGGESLQAIVICPSNPYLSIEPLLAVPEFRAAMQRRRVPSIAVSPLVKGQAVKGPAAKIMRELGMPVSAGTIAQRYQGLIDALVVDEDEVAGATIDGLPLLHARTMMRSADDRLALARTVLDLAVRLQG